MKDDELLQMIEDCETRESQLTQWENEFIQSLAEQVEKGLSEKQINKLESIWERVT